MKAKPLILLMVLKSWLYFANPSQGFSQADFYLDSSYCINQNISIGVVLPESPDAGYDHVNWDFCPGEFRLEPSVETLSTEPGITNVRGMTLVFYEGSNYIFLADQVTGSLYRYRLTVDNRGILSKTELLYTGEALVTPEEIEIISHGGQWYGFIGSNTSARGITRIDFGTTLLNNTPNSVLLGNFDISSRFRDLHVTHQGDSLILTLLALNTKTLVRINYGDSFENTPLTTDIYTDIMSETTFPNGLEIIRIDDQWIAYIMSPASQIISRYDLGTDITSTPIFKANYNFPGFNRPFRMEVVKESNHYYGLVTNERTDLTVIDLKQLNDTDVVEELDYSMPSVYDLTGLYSEGSFIYFGLERSDLRRIIFDNDCAASKKYSREKHTTVSYSLPGTFGIALTAYDADGNNDQVTKTTIITADTAPTLSFAPTTLCQSSPVAFTSESDGAGLTYSWHFGDAGTAAEANPAHTYAAPGDYEVTLSVDDGTCGNFVQDTITVYPEPEPDFTIPGGVICTNQPVTFNNTTPGDFGDNITWQWEVDEEPRSGDQNLNFTFASGGDKAIRLIATIPGCSVEVVKHFTGIQEGPIPRFTFDDSCPGEEIPFRNGSAGEYLQYHWDFDYDCCATVENPIRSFPEPGVFDVTLTLTDTVTGCVTPLTKPITIYTVPDALFEAELACEQLATQLNDLSTIELYNLDSWEWNFGDGSPTAAEQNPQHVYRRSGAYPVTLKATSDAGCTDSVTQLVNVKPAPQADFEYDKRCLGEPVTFTDTSVPVGGQAITSRGWNIAGIFTAEKSPVVTFDIPLAYKASLTVSSENLCISTYETIIEIPPAPVLDFTVGNNCENEKTILTQSISMEGDVAEDLTWFLAGSPVGRDSQAILSLSAGDYPAGLEIATVNGCNYAFEKIITVHPPPVAAFAASATFGAPPLQVAFTDRAVQAVSYRWDFADGSTSSEENPTHEFEDTGEYDVSLIVTSSENCKDTTVTRITVLIPQLDLEIINLSLVSAVLGDKISMTLRNNGTVTIDSVQVTLDLGGQLIVREILSVNLPLNRSATAQLPLKFTNRRLDYICVEAVPLAETVETDESNNSKCLNFSGEPVIFAVPYPNPVTNGQLNMDIIAENEGEVAITMMSNIGQLVFSRTEKLLAGSNRLTLVTDHLFEGLYLVSVEHAGISKLYRIAVVR